VIGQRSRKSNRRASRSASVMHTRSHQSRLRITVFEQEERRMPAGATKKEERQYEHIKDSYQERGVSTDEAEERAARTVNKQKGKSKDKKKD
jgi:hypothetical protein